MKVVYRLDLKIVMPLRTAIIFSTIVCFSDVAWYTVKPISVFTTTY